MGTSPIRVGVRVTNAYEFIEVQRGLNARGFTWASGAVSFDKIGDLVVGDGAVRNFPIVIDVNIKRSHLTYSRTGCANPVYEDVLLTEEWEDSIGIPRRGRG